MKAIRKLWRNLWGYRIVAGMDSHLDIHGDVVTTVAVARIGDTHTTVTHSLRFTHVCDTVGFLKKVLPDQINWEYNDNQAWVIMRHYNEATS